MTEDQLNYLNEFVPQDARALANLGTDQSDTVRWVYPGADEAAAALMSFARALAAKVGRQTPAKQVPIVWHAQARARSFRAVQGISRALRCSSFRPHGSGTRSC